MRAAVTITCPDGFGWSSRARRGNARGRRRRPAEVADRTASPDHPPRRSGGDVRPDGRRGAGPQRGGSASDVRRTPRPARSGSSGSSGDGRICARSTRCRVGRSHPRTRNRLASSVARPVSVGFRTGPEGRAPTRRAHRRAPRAAIPRYWFAVPHLKPARDSGPGDPRAGCSAEPSASTARGEVPIAGDQRFCTGRSQCGLVLPIEMEGARPAEVATCARRSLSAARATDSTREAHT